MSRLSEDSDDFQLEPFLTYVRIGEPVGDATPSLTQGQAWCLYLSHSLSMWNSRMYEFGAILFIQAAFPGNLVTSSINGIAETLCVLLFSSALGRWVDNSSDRLLPLILTIVINRITVVVSCIAWLLILFSENNTIKHVLFGAVLFLGMVEKLSRMTNILSMERDWVPTIADATVEAGDSYDLTYLNTVMRRIDQLCKLLAPLSISVFVSAFPNVRVVVGGVAIISMISWAPEYLLIQRVWKQNFRIKAPKPIVDEEKELETESGMRSSRWLTGCLSRIWLEAKLSAHAHLDGLHYYFTNPILIPSFCVAILHGSVLTYSATLITYLLNAGFSLPLVTVAKALGSVFEIGSTFLFPWTVAKFGGNSANLHGYGKVDEEDMTLENCDGARAEKELEQTTSNTELGVVKTGMWSISSLFLFLVPVLISIFLLPSHPAHESDASTPIKSPFTASPIATISLLLLLSSSLLPRWTYDLSATQLAQSLIPAPHRSSFGGTEMAIVGLISLGHWVSAATWHTQESFKWLAMGSFGGVGVGAVAYAIWYRRWMGRRAGGLTKRS